MERLRKRLALLLSHRRKRTRRIPVAERFTYYRAIGAANDAFLHQLASLQETLDRSTLSGLGTLASATESLSAHVGAMAKSLMAMSQGRYEALLQRYEALHLEICPEIRKMRPVETGPFVVWPTDVDAVRPQVVGPKAARLAEVASIPA